MNVFILDKKLNVRQTITFEIINIGDTIPISPLTKVKDNTSGKQTGVKHGDRKRKQKVQGGQDITTDKSTSLISYTGSKELARSAILDEITKMDNPVDYYNAVPIGTASLNGGSRTLVKGAADADNNSGQGPVGFDEQIVFTENDFEIEINEVIEPKKTKDSSAASQVIYNKDNILELRKKIQLASGIPLYRQHLYYITNNVVTPLSYKLVSATIQKVDIRDILNLKQDIEGVPVDPGNMISIDHSDLVIESFEEFRLVEKLPSRELYLVDLGDFFTNKSAFENIINDVYMCNLIYYSFVVKYWPMLTMGVFLQYIKNEKEIEQYFPMLSPDPSQLRAIFKKEDEINAEFLAEEIKHNDRIKMGITSAILYNNDSNEINLRNLFDKMILSEFIPYMRCITNIEGTDVELSKQYKKSLINRDRLEMNELLLQIIVKLPNGLFTTAIFVINNQGQYFVSSQWRDDFFISFDDLYSIIADNVNPIIDTINSFGKYVVTRGITKINRYVTKLINLSLSIYWKQALSRDNFNEIVGHFTRLKDAGIIQSKQSVIGGMDFVFLKGMYGFNHQNIEEVVKNINNYYTRFIDGSVRQKWESMFNRNRVLKLLHRYSDMKIEINNIKEAEYSVVVFYVLRILQWIKPQDEKYLDVDKKLKKLKEVDPELYDFKKAYQSDQVLSKKCQKPLQPILWTQEEYAERKDVKDFKAVKYWNFTKNEPVYYECPNSKYPHMRFITGVHPKGFCIPCCKKTPVIENDTNKKSLLHKSCMENHVPDNIANLQKSKSKYVSSFGKDILPWRLSLLPKGISETIFHEDVISDDLCQNVEDYFLLGVEQIYKGKFIGAISVAAAILVIDVETLIQNIQTYFERHENLLGIMSVDWAFESVQEMFEELDSTNPKNTDFLDYWNDFILQIVSVIYNVRFVVFTVDGDSMQMEVPDNLNTPDDFLLDKIAIVIRKPHDSVNFTWSYYPVIYTNKDIFYGTRAIKKTAFTREDYPVINIWEFIKLKLRGTNDLTVDLYKVKFIADKYGYKIIKHFINRANNCYAVLISKTKEFYIPVVDSYYAKSSDKEGLTKRTRTQSIKHNVRGYDGYVRVTDIEPVLSFIELYNKHWPKVTIDALLRYGKKYIGFSGNGLNFYGNMATKFAEKLIKKYNCPEQLLLYDPDDINDIINQRHDDIDVKWNKKVHTALYHKYIYQLIIMEFAQLFNSEKNHKKRAELIKIAKGKVLQSDENVKKLHVLLDEYPEDFDIIKKLFIAAIEHGDRELLIKQIDETEFEFDKVLMHRILFAKDPYTELLKLSTKILIEKDIDNINFENTIIACGENSSAEYCSGRKLIVPRGSTKPYMELLLADMQNPLKKKILFSRLFIKYIIEPWKFTKQPYETITIDFLT